MTFADEMGQAVQRYKQANDEISIQKQDQLQQIQVCIHKILTILFGIIRVITTTTFHEQALQQIQQNLKDAQKQLKDELQQQENTTKQHAAQVQV